MPLSFEMFRFIRNKAYRICLFEDTAISFFVFSIVFMEVLITLNKVLYSLKLQSYISDS